MKWNELKWNEMKWNEMKWNETEQNKMKWKLYKFKWNKQCFFQTIHHKYRQHCQPTILASAISEKRRQTKIIETEKIMCTSLPIDISLD